MRVGRRLLQVRPGMSGPPCKVMSKTSEQAIEEHRELITGRQMHAAKELQDFRLTADIWQPTTANYFRPVSSLSLYMYLMLGL